MNKIILWQHPEVLPTKAAATLGAVRTEIAITSSNQYEAYLEAKILELLNELNFKTNQANAIGLLEVGYEASNNIELARAIMECDPMAALLTDTRAAWQGIGEMAATEYFAEQQEAPEETPMLILDETRLTTEDYDALSFQSILERLANYINL